MSSDTLCTLYKKVFCLFVNKKSNYRVVQEEEISSLSYVKLKMVDNLENSFLLIIRASAK